MKTERAVLGRRSAKNSESLKGSLKGNCILPAVKMNDLYSFPMVKIIILK